jgi:Dolichyl-phosphate-mannose-protein mannosyltransferase
MNNRLAANSSLANEAPAQQLRTFSSVIFIFAATFALYFLSRSPGLDEWDSVQFAMGIREFNLWKHQPHPPGYPLYIFFAWLAVRLFGWSPEFSLQFLSCAGGALFVGAWFCIVRLQFGERFAWLVAGALAITPVVWMTSIRALTDSLAAGLLSAQLFCSLLFRENARKKQLIAIGLLGAAAAGVRPQFLPVALLILITSLFRRRAGAKIWLTGGAIFVAGCLLWLVPTWYIESTLPGPVTGWRSYPTQLYSQWLWRFGRPSVFIGGSHITPLYFARQFAVHILGWFGIGLGFLWSPFSLVAGALLAACAFVVYAARLDDQDHNFLKTHWPWAFLQIAIVFCFLPADQRYYLLIMPLLIVTLLRGFFHMPAPFRLGVCLLPALLLGISIPAAIESHSDPPPPIKLVRFMQQQYPPEQRDAVLLFLGGCQRHFEWYAPEFTVFDNGAFSTVSAERLEKAKAIYTDELRLAHAPDWQLSLVAEFSRSVVIYGKHHYVRLFRVERRSAP